MLESPSENMPPSARVLALQDESHRTSEVTPSNKSKCDKGVGVASPIFRTALGQRNIYIGKEDPTVQLLKQAKKIISESHQPSEMDDATILLHALIGVLGSGLFPAMAFIPDQKLEARRNETWTIL